MLSSKKDFSSMSAAVIFLLIFFFPLGLFLMWRNTQWSSKIKWSVSAIFASLAVISTFLPNDNVKTHNYSSSDNEDWEEGKEKCIKGVLFVKIDGKPLLVPDITCK